VVLSREEVIGVFRCIPNYMYRVMLMTMYAGGLRMSETLRLRPEDIDSKRGMIRIQQGKGRTDRYVPLSEMLLDILRSYWKIVQPQEWLFPGQKPEHYLSGRTLRRAPQEVAADPRHLGAKIGVLAVLHTWGQNLHHPHIHCIVSVHFEN
jgi:integrase/recombinase XerD